MARASDPILAREAATRVVQTLQTRGHIAYFAGGCVRDALLGLHPTDFDIATDATPDQLRVLFPRTAEVGAAFGVVLVHEAGATVEVATFRSDGTYTDKRRPDRVHFSDPNHDAQRRDFTINALFLDPLAPPDPLPQLPKHELPGKVIDLVGGVNDLTRRVLRAVGDPDQRLAEDHLRALRAVRFAARLDFTLDPATAQACTRHAGGLAGVSRERIGEELRRMLLHPRRATAIHLLETLALDAPVLQEPTQVTPLRLLAGLPPEADVAASLSAWFLDRQWTAAPESFPDPEASAATRARWRKALNLSNLEHEDLCAVLACAHALANTWDALGVAARKRLVARRGFTRSLWLIGAWSPTRLSRLSAEISTLREDGVGVSPDPILNGDELVALGWRPGPAFKRILESVYDAQLEGRIRTRQEAVELAERLRVQPPV